MTKLQITSFIYQSYAILYFLKSNLHFNIFRWIGVLSSLTHLSRKPHLHSRRSLGFSTDIAKTNPTEEFLFYFYFKFVLHLEPILFLAAMDVNPSFTTILQMTNVAQSAYLNRRSNRVVQRSSHKTKSLILNYSLLSLILIRPGNWPILFSSFCHYFPHPRFTSQTYNTPSSFLTFTAVPEAQRRLLTWEIIAFTRLFRAMPNLTPSSLTPNSRQFCPCGPSSWNNSFLLLCISFPRFLITKHW